VPWCALGCLLPAAAIAWWSLARSTPAHRSEEKPIAAG